MTFQELDAIYGCAHERHCYKRIQRTLSYHIRYFGFAVPFNVHLGMHFSSIANRFFLFFVCDRCGLQSLPSALLG